MQKSGDKSMPSKPTRPHKPNPGRSSDNQSLPPGGRLPPLSVTGKSMPTVKRSPRIKRTGLLAPIAKTFDPVLSEITEEQREQLFISGGEKFSAGLIANLEKLKKCGFPELHAEAFQDTADRTNCVIATRVPGADKTTPILEGYDLKSYLIKPKSCDWGPMQGFLCQLPCFNKNGSEAIESNDNNYVKYFEYLRDKCDPSSVASGKSVGYDSQLHTAVKDGQTPFISLRISDQRKDEVLKSIPNELKELKISSPQQICGFAFDKKTREESSVVMEFLLNKEEGEETWGVYHGRVYFRQDKNDKAWKNFLNENISYLTTNTSDTDSLNNKNKLKVMSVKDNNGRTINELVAKQPKALVTPAKAEEIICPTYYIGSWLKSQLEKKFEIKGLLPDQKFYPVYVAQNPFPPYVIREKSEGESLEAYAKYKVAIEKKFYKNAVTGDYDLFFVYPVQPAVGWRDMVRPHDLIAPPPLSSSVFLQVIAKRFALEIRATPDAFVEIIPGFTEIEPFESPETGNVNNATSTVVQFLNDRVKTQTKLGVHSPNVSFHNDEAGRPGIDSIDYEFAVFLPSTLAAKLMTNEGPVHALFIDKHDGFLEVIRLLAGNCYVILNHAWLMQLFTLLHPDLKNLSGRIKTTQEPNSSEKAAKIVKKRNDFLKERITEHSKLDRKQLEAINEELAKLFLGQSRAKKMLEGTLESQIYKKAWADVIDAFTSLAIRDFDNATAQVEALMNLAIKWPVVTSNPPGADSTSDRPNSDTETQ
jgi:hypothetical protein